MAAWMWWTVLTAGDVRVPVTGADAQPDQVLCSLFSEADGFPGDVSRAKKTRAVVQDGVPVCIFKDVPPGPHAASVLHDTNNNGRLDSSIVGYPQEPWGVSRGVRPTLRPPTFEEAAVDVPSEGATIPVTVAR